MGLGRDVHGADPARPRDRARRETGEGDPHVSSLTDEHRPDGDAPHEDGLETGCDPGVMRL